MRWYVAQYALNFYVNILATEGLNITYNRLQDIQEAICQQILNRLPHPHPLLQPDQFKFAVKPEFIITLHLQQLNHHFMAQAQQFSNK